MNSYERQSDSFQSPDDFSRDPEERLRRTSAQELADKLQEPLLVDVLMWHMAFTNGRIQSLLKHDVDLYQVGRNATHSFYVGVKNGQRYRYSVGEGTYDELTEEISLDEDFRAVDQFQGYFGHI